MRNFLGGGLLALMLFSTSLSFPQFVRADSPSVEELKDISSVAKTIENKNNLFDVPIELKPTIAASSAKYKVPEALLAALIKKESEFQNIWGVDGTGRGIAQIDSYWHPEVSDKEAFDPAYALAWAAKYLKGLKEEHGSWYNALRAYNGGPNYASWRTGYGGMSVAYITELYANTIYEYANEYTAIKEKVEAIVELPKPLDDVKSKSAELTNKAEAEAESGEVKKLVEKTKKEDCKELSCTLPTDFKDTANIAQETSEVEPNL